MVNEKIETINELKTVEEIRTRLESLEHDTRTVSSPEELEALEREILALTNRYAAFLLQKKLQDSLNSEEQQNNASRLVKTLPGRMRNEGYTIVEILTAGGFSIQVSVRYYRRSCDRRKGKRYKGVYAGLVLVGIYDRCTPKLAAMISAWSALLSSFQEVHQVLLEQGFKLDVKVIRKLTYRYAARARVLQQTGQILSAEGETLDGRRVVVSMDGGRIRMRENKRGRKTLKGRTRYNGAWREPKLMIIYVVTSEGKLDRSFSPLIDGSVKGPDSIFELLKVYLESLCIRKADQILFVADGAHWIWKRIPKLISALSLSPDRVHQLIDFYHAVEHLGKVAGFRKVWSGKERKSWISKQRGRLLKGDVGAVIDAVKKICRGRQSKAIATERDYFVRNQHRMAYQKVKTLNLPIGSGAIESAIRRVVNLRLKGPCTFWYKENAERILMLRSFYKSGRWNQLKQMANSHLSLLAV
jgi:hypothetical protein